MAEEYGNISDGFFLTPEEVETLRQSKKELTDYGKQKLKQMMNENPTLDEMLEEANRREVANKELEKEEWERKQRSDRILERYNSYHNLETSGLAWGIITPEQQQAIALQSMVDAMLCEHLNQEYTHIAIDDIKDLIARLYQQSDEFLERVKTLSTNVETTENSEND